MQPVPVFPDYLVKLVIPVSRAILKPAVIYRCVSLILYVKAMQITPWSGSTNEPHKSDYGTNVQEFLRIRPYNLRGSSREAQDPPRTRFQVCCYMYHFGTIAKCVHPQVWAEQRYSQWVARET